MAKVKTEHYTHRECGIDFKYDINVNVDGEFSATLPESIVAMIEGAGIQLDRNSSRRNSRKGYMVAQTLNDLVAEVSDLLKEYTSTTIVSETIVLKYCIQTQCTYCLDKDGEIVPNGYYGVKDSDGHCNWKGGTISMHAASTAPFGLQVYVKPFVKRVMRYKSGKLKTEYAMICFAGLSIFDGSRIELDYYGKWLDSICSISPIGVEREMPYTEKMAEFFVNMIKSICRLNENIKDFLEPDELIKLANNGQKLLV